MQILQGSWKLIHAALLFAVLLGLIAQPAYAQSVHRAKAQSVTGPSVRVTKAFSDWPHYENLPDEPLGKHPAAAATPADYGQWESLSTTGGLSPDGKWVVYAINRSDRNNELRFANLADATTKVIAFGAQPTFSADSRWMAYSIGYSEAQEERLSREKKPVRMKLGLMNLSSGNQTVLDDIESFSFSPDGAYVAMHRYALQKKDAPDGAADDSDSAPGATVIVRHLDSERDTAFGNVSESAWQNLPQRGHMLAMTISTDDKVGNGVQLFDPETGMLRVLDSSPSTYSGISWRKSSADLAVLRSKVDEYHEGPTQVALAWTHLGGASESSHVYDPTTDVKFPVGMRTVAFHKPSWSDDGATVFLGIAKWDEGATDIQKTTAKTDGDGDRIGSGKDEKQSAAVDIWHWRDVEVMPKQKVDAREDHHRSMLTAWHVETGRFIQLQKYPDEQVTPLSHQKVAYAVNWAAYAMDRALGRSAADLYLVDLATGARTEIKKRITEFRIPEDGGRIFLDRYVVASPGGGYLVYVQDDHYWTVNVATHAVVNITKGVPTSFLDRESDHVIKQKETFGIAGWTNNDAAVILNTEFDLWQVTPDGAHAARLTDGTAEQIRHRYVALDPEEESIDTDKPLYLSVFGIWTKKSGYARLRLSGSGAAGNDEHLIWADKSVDQLTKAKNTDLYEYVTQSFEVSPNIFVGGPNLKDAKQITNTNPFQSNYAWGHEELIDYKNDHGKHLQGALYYPAGYVPGKKYPMVVYVYEKPSSKLHRYSAPSERDYYSIGAITSHGYFVLQPDIIFRPREPGLSVVECVTPAVNRVIQMGLVNPQKVGVIGHSWGGFDVTYLATHTNLFAAAVAGAPVTDLVSLYGNHQWSSGISEADLMETGQPRMEVPLWEDLPAYIRNSALFNVQNMTTPLLIEVGDKDGTVFFHQGVELYNVARRAKKEVVLLVYAGEDHGLRQKANQMDYHRRIFEWFGYYLKGEPAPSWITNGESYLDREREVKQIKLQSGKN
jgi:dipeptidyl aminopeptidase/acylaminoacyl peptidase